MTALKVFAHFKMVCVPNAKGFESKILKKSGFYVLPNFFGFVYKEPSLFSTKSGHFSA